MKEDGELSIVEPARDVSTEGAHETQGNKVKPGGARRRRLSTDEGREIARLYAETNTSDIGHPRAVWYRRVVALPHCAATRHTAARTDLVLEGANPSATTSPGGASEAFVQ